MRLRHPRKAVVLAAGYGARLLPLTLVRPKPLFPLWGKPVLGYTLDLLREWGVEEVLVNVHHLAGQILEYVINRPHDGLRCNLSFEPGILGTGGALPRAKWFMDDEPFWMINADILADLPCRPLLEAHAKYSALATLWLHPAKGPRTVEHRKGLVTVFRSPLPGTEGTATFCGVQLLSPRILRYLPPSGFASIIDAYENAMSAGERIAAVTIPHAYWADIGGHKSYLTTHWEMARHPKWHAMSSGMPDSVAIGCHTRMAASAKITRSVLWDNVTLSTHAHLENAIVSDGVTVRGSVNYMALRAEHCLDPVLTRVLRRLKWSPDRTMVQPLPPRGSARTFTRLVPRRGPGAMLVRYTLERPENGLYASLARFLSHHGVSVPSVLVDWPEEMVCALEDVGDTSLEQLANNDLKSRSYDLYTKTLDTVILLHVAATKAALRRPPPLSMPFTRHLYRWEHNLFCEQYMARFCDPGHASMGMIKAELDRLTGPLLQSPRVLVHRDLQSSNVLVRNNNIFLIDFQGMRFGAAAYDLASLLCDPYVALHDDIRADLLDYYCERIENGSQVRQLFWIAAVQRLVQALGAYGRLGSVPATAYFLKHIPSGVAQLRNALGHVDGLPVLTRVMRAGDTPVLT